MEEARRKLGADPQPDFRRVVDTLWRRDDVPCFLRCWMNNYAAFVQPNGGLSEASSGEQPAGDTGTTGWIMENFRILLVMQDCRSPWPARATLRAWLEQDKKIAVKNAPTHFGTVSYEIASDADKGRITATVEMPARNPPKSVVLRFRHPKSAPIQSVTVNGKAWKDFDPAREVVRLVGMKGSAAVAAGYSK